MRMTIVAYTDRVKQAMEAGTPLVVTQDEYDAIDAAGLLHDDESPGTIEVAVE